MGNIQLLELVYPAANNWGRVNFLENVRSGGNPLKDRPSFDQFGKKHYDWKSSSSLRLPCFLNVRFCFILSFCKLDGFSDHGR